MLILVGLLVIWFLIVKWQRRPFDKLYEQLKISAPRLPFIGHLYITLCDSEEGMKRIQLLGKEAINAGGTTGVWMFNKLYINIADSEVANTVLKTCLEKDDSMKCFHIVIGDGSIFASVKTWRPRRKFLAPTFSIKNLSKFVELFTKQSGVLLEKLKKDLEAGPVATEKMYSLYILSIVFDSIAINANVKENVVHQTLLAMKKVVNALTDRLFQPWLYNDFVYKLSPRYRASVSKHKRWAYEFLHQIIQERRKSYENHIDKLDSDKTEMNDENGIKSFIDLMIESSENLSDVVIREESIVMMTAAGDTSSVALGYATLMLARHPEVQEIIYEELKETLDDFERPIMAKDLLGLKYLDAFIKETLRLFPPVPVIARKIDKHIQLPSGVTLLPGCGALINIWAINRNPKYWGEDAEQFRPERFLDSTPRHPAAFATFSHGPRNCLGYQYAMMSMKTVLATILKQYRIVAASDELKHEPLRVKFDIMMRLVNKIRVKFVPRKEIIS